MNVAFLLGLAVAAALAVAMAIMVGRPALDRLHRWLDWRHAARMQVRRKLAIHRSLWTSAAATPAAPAQVGETACADRSE